MAMYRIIGVCFLILQSSKAFAWVAPNKQGPSKMPNAVEVQDSLRRSIMTGFVSSAAATLTCSSPARALVKGVAPPTKQKPMSDKPKCTNVEECQEMAERKARQEAAEQDTTKTPQLTTAGGVKYRDIEVGPDGADVVKMGNDVTIYYQVLKLGKRSYDGLSGEGTVVFSRGYGFEDDEAKPGMKSFITTVGSPQNIKALNEALVGMKVGGTRRFAVLPQMGWEKPTAYCDGGPGGHGAGGTLKTDYVVVPTATMVATEDCLDKTKLPFPTTYAEQRRMAQRFDQSLIMEVQVVKTGPSELA